MPGEPRAWGGVFLLCVRIDQPGSLPKVIVMCSFHAAVTVSSGVTEILSLPSAPVGVGPGMLPLGNVGAEPGTASVIHVCGQLGWASSGRRVPGVRGRHSVSLMLMRGRGWLRRLRSPCVRVAAGPRREMRITQPSEAF